MTDTAEPRRRILLTIQEIVGDVLDYPELELREEMTARDVPGWDSMSHVQIVIAIEQEFGIRMSSSEVAGMQNAGSLIDVVQRRTENRASA